MIAFSGPCSGSSVLCIDVFYHCFLPKPPQYRLKVLSLFLINRDVQKRKYEGGIFYLLRPKVQAHNTYQDHE